MAYIGYARVSTVDQSTNLQTDALKGAGCIQIYTDKMSGGTTDRPGLTQALQALRSEDTLVVWRLDRLGRSLRHLIDLVGRLQDMGVQLVSLTEGIDTTTPSGKLTFHVFSALAEFEKGVIRERVRAGLEAARQRGRVGGRPTVVTSAKAQAIKAMLKQGASPNEICTALSISRATFFRHRPQD